LPINPRAIRDSAVADESSATLIIGAPINLKILPIQLFGPQVPRH